MRREGGLFDKDGALKVRIRQLPEFLAPLWWMIGLIAVLLLLAVIAFASQATRHYRRIVVKMRILSTSATRLANTPLPTTPLASSPLRGEVRVIKRLDLFWSSVTTNLTIGLVFLCVSCGALSLVLPRPAWFPLITITAPFLAAWFANRAWERED